MSGGWFSNLQLPDPAKNQLLDLASIDQNVNKTQYGQLANQTTQQDLTDRAQLQSLAPDLGSADPAVRQNALAHVAVLPGGAGAINSLAQYATANANMIAPPSAPSDSTPAPSYPAPPQGFQAPTYQPGQSLFGSGPAPAPSDPNVSEAVRATAAKAGVNPEWATRVAGAESGGYADPTKAISPKGAIGTMQLMPETAKGLGVDPADPAQNIQGGVAYLGQLKQQFSSPILATAAYNAGPGRVQAYLAGKADLPPETIHYVGRVFGGDGNQLIHEALAGAHGHAIPGYAPHDQMASLQGTAGMPQAANDASGAAPQAPTAQAQAPQQPAPQIPNQNALYQQPQQPPQAQPQPQPPAIDPNSIVHYNSGLPVTTGLPAGYVYIRGQNGALQAVPNPNIHLPPDHKIDNGIDYITDKIDGHLISANRIGPSASRVTPVQGPNGTELYQDGGKIGTVAPNTRPEQASLLKDDYAQVPALSQAGRDAELQQQRAIEARDIAAQLPTGAGYDARQGVANFLQTYAPSAIPAVNAIMSGNLPDAAKGQEVAKLLLSQASQDEKSMGGSGGLGLTQLYAKANPNLNLQPQALRDLSNLKAVTSVAAKDYAQGKLNYIDQNGTAFLQHGSGYKPAAAFDREWLSGNSANVYMGAVNAINGRPFAEWSKGLSPADAKRALAVVARIDPNSTVIGANGHPLPVSKFAPPTAQPGQATAQNPSGVTP